MVIFSFLLTKLEPKITNIVLSAALVTVGVGQFFFYQQSHDQKIYTYTNKGDVVANYELLSKYFDKVHNNENNISMHSTVILTICENRNLSDLNAFEENVNYIILGEHDNLNHTVDQCSYINNDGYYRKAPWYVYSPCMNSCLKYFSKDDIFYCSNIGATVNSGSPLIWDYDIFGKPIILTSFKKINGANVYIFGDSDFMVNKLMPYNINFISGLLNRGSLLHSVFIILAALLNVAILWNKRCISSILFMLMLVSYFFPCKENYNSEVNLYYQDKYLTAHTSSHSSSILNFLAQNNIAVVNSNQKDAQVQIVSSDQKWENIKNSKLIYLLPGTSLSADGEEIFCSHVKLGTVNWGNNEIVDARILILNGKKTNKAIYIKDNINFVCTGSPQLNHRLTRSLVLHEK